MSTEAIYLRGRIYDKLHEGTNCLRRLVAHHNLYARVLQLAEESNEKRWLSKAMLDQVIETGQDNIALGEDNEMSHREDKGMSTAEDHAMSTTEDKDAICSMTECFGALTLEDSYGSLKNT